MAITRREGKELFWQLLFFIGFFWVAIGAREQFEAMFGNGGKTFWAGVAILIFILWQRNYRGSINFRK